MHVTTKTCTCYKISLGIHMENNLWNQKLHTNVAKARIHYICTWQTNIILYINCIVRPSVYRGSKIRGPVHPSVEVLKPKSGPVCLSLCRSRPFPRSNCRRRCCLKSTATAAVNTKGFFFFRPFLADCPRLIPGFF
jgi:hypothetical protein